MLAHREHILQVNARCGIRERDVPEEWSGKKAGYELFE